MSSFIPSSISLPSLGLPLLCLVRLVFLRLLCLHLFHLLCPILLRLFHLRLLCLFYHCLFCLFSQVPLHLLRLHLSRSVLCICSVFVYFASICSIYSNSVYSVYFASVCFIYPVYPVCPIYSIGSVCFCPICSVYSIGSICFFCICFALVVLIYTNTRMLQVNQVELENKKSIFIRKNGSSPFAPVYRTLTISQPLPVYYLWPNL